MANRVTPKLIYLNRPPHFYPELTTKEKTFRQSRGREGGRWMGKRKRK